MSVDFGTASNYATATVTGQTGILSGSLVEAWVSVSSSGTRTEDDCINEDLKVVAGSISPGTGFTVYVNCMRGYAHGSYDINWVWN